MDGKKRELALAAIEQYLAAQHVAFEPFGEGVRVGADEMFCSPDRMTAPGAISPDTARLMVGCALALDWPAVIAAGDPDSIDSFIMAGVQEEIAAVNCAAGEQALSLIRSNFGERLHQAVANYDRLGAARASVRCYRAFQFQRAMAYRRRPSTEPGNVASVRPTIRAAQFQKALAYHAGRSAAAAIPLLAAGAAADDESVVAAGSSPKRHSGSKWSSAQFVRSMAYGAARTRGSHTGAGEAAGHPSVADVDGLETARAALSRGSMQFRGIEATLVQRATGSTAPSDEPQLVSMRKSR